MNANPWRERQKALRKEHDERRRAELAADPRVQAMKRALAERRRAISEEANATRPERAQARRAAYVERRAEKAQRERELRDAELRALVHPATVEGHERKQ